MNGASDAGEVAQDVGGEQKAEVPERGDARDGKDKVQGAGNVGGASSGAQMPEMAGADGTGGHGKPYGW